MEWNIIMMDYNIRFANRDDISSIMRFIDENWRKNHILSRDRNLFEWQYINKNKVNMVLGLDDKLEIQGILGYIPYDDDVTKDMALSLWKVKPCTSFLGIKLLMFLLEKENYRNVFCNGINIRTSESIYHRFNIKTRKLKQWYRLQDLTEYSIAKVANKRIPIMMGSSDVELVRVVTFQELQQQVAKELFNRESVPYKSESYINKRYFEHPTYEYIVYAIKNMGQSAQSVVVFRLDGFRGAKALRLIDFIGRHEQLYLSTIAFDLIAKGLGVEYIDMYENGLDDYELIRAGWQLVGDDDNIIPNYFSPFIQSNVDIYISTMDEKMILFKGDGDQDRPN